jgi:hypothetical protein
LFLRSLDLAPPAGLPLAWHSAQGLRNEGREAG